MLAMPWRCNTCPSNSPDGPPPMMQTWVRMVPAVTVILAKVGTQGTFGAAIDWHYRNMETVQNRAEGTAAIPVFALYGEGGVLPDVLHCECISERAAGYDWVPAPHRHADLHQFFVLTSGMARITVDGVTHRVDAPRMLSLPRRTVHGFGFAHGTQGDVVTLPASEFPQLFGADSPLSAALSQWQSLPAPATIAALFDQVQDWHRQRGPVRPVMLRALAMQIACHVAVWPGPRRATRRPIAAFDALLARHLRDHWPVAAHADALAVTPAHLNRIVKAATGLPVAAFVEHHLLIEACRLLAYTTAPVASIGYALGYDDPSYFSRAFQRRIGMSPRTYRARATG